MTDNKSPEGTDGTGDTTVVLTAKEYKELTEKLATKVQDTVNMSQELIDLREKNRKLAEQPQVETKDIAGVVEAELAKRDSETQKVNQATALTRWLEAHSEFSPENDKDGSNFAAFQKALGRINLVGVKTESDYTQVLDDALRLTEQVSTPQPLGNPMGSSPRNFAPVMGKQNYGSNLSSQEVKLINDNFGGDVEKYLKVKTKRPEYIEEILKWVK